MMPLRNVLLVAALLSPGPPWRADAAKFQVHVDVSKTPNAQPYVKPVKALCEEWYPRINIILFGKDAPLPFKELHIRFEPKVEKCDGPNCIEAGGFADENTIQINFGYLGRMKDDYRAMIVHELAHIDGARDDEIGFAAHVSTPFRSSGHLQSASHSQLPPSSDTVTSASHGIPDVTSGRIPMRR